MKKRFLILTALIFCFSIFILTSCSHGITEGTAFSKAHIESINKEKTKKAFVHVGTGFVVDICDKNGLNCLPAISTPSIISSSGSIIKSDKDGSVVLTTGHTCRKYFAHELPSLFPATPNVKIKLKSKFYISTTDGISTTKVNLVTYNYSNTDANLDICLLYTEDLKNRVALDISHDSPKYGDKVFNIGAPLGLFFDTAVPFTDGFFSGNISKKSALYKAMLKTSPSFSSVQSLYTFAATNGSSGSPIMNEKGQVLAIVHSKHPGFDNVIFAISHDNLIKFLKEHGILPPSFRVQSN